MCRFRRDALAFHPRPLSSSSSAAASPTTFFSTTNSSSSLTSLRSSLPTTPSLYSPSDISSAILHPRTEPLSSSSFRCSLRNRDVFLHSRQFRGDPQLLPARLADLCKSHHRSLVRLLGATLSSNAIYLVYDFAPGATLSACLRNSNNPAFTPLSSWISRMQIAADLAQGLDYIHHNAAGGGVYIHNLINSSSIIVSDIDFHAKICYFGAAVLAGEIDSRSIVGTTGYLSPEVIAGGCVTDKSDVYALGVVLLELLSGDEPLKCSLKAGGEKRSYEWVSLVERAREVVGLAGSNGDGSERMERVRFWVDKRLKDSFPLAVAEKMMVVAVRCVESDAAKRPGMGWVQGKISQLFLESKVWNEKIRAPVEISATFGPR